METDQPAVASSFELPTILSRLMDQMEPIADSAPALVFLQEPPAGRYSLYLARNFGALQDVDLSYERGGAMAREMVAATGPICLPDVGSPTSGAWAEEEGRRSRELGLVVFLPLRSSGEDEPLAGWVALGPRPSGEPYTPDELRFLAALVDLTTVAIENARLHERVREADRAKSEFIDFVAHELKQPMTAILGYARMLTMGIGGPLNDPQTQFVEVINKNVDRMGKLVNDLLEISRLEAGRTHLKLTPVHLGEVVNETVVNTRTEIEARHHSLEIDTPGELPLVLGDRERLVQILTNLVSNAYKYTPNGGTIRIAVGPACNGEDTFDVPPGHLCIQVSDTGIGIAAQDLIKLEKKFFRADDDLVQAQPGTGLGVSITRNLVTLHGGKFFVESEPGAGSTFGFTVPIAEPQPGESGAAPDPVG
jgi:signal transduction histidine kinase